jgi:prepilin-type N-terminal cleavage/methylation domain-containing protein
MTLPSSPSPRPATRGFTLLELVGAMAIMTVVAAAVAPPTVRQLSRMFRDREARALQKIGNAVVDHVRRAHAVPSHTNFVASLAPRLGWSANQVLNSQFGQRVVLIDDGFRVGPGAGARPPFVQTGATSIRPTNPRMMIVSSVGQPLPAGLASGFLATATFSNLWHTAPGTVPSGWNWNGNPDDLLIQRVNLADQFVEVVLNATGTQFGRYTIDRGLTNVLFAAPASLFVVRGTRLGLHGADGRLQTLEIVNEPMTLAFATGIWRADLAGAIPTWLADRDLDGCDLQAVVDSFVTSPANPRSDYTPTHVADTFADVMEKYCDYARSGFHHTKRGAYSSSCDRMEQRLSRCAD